MSISARESNLGELLWDHSAYFVPVYQRDYSWDKEQTSSFWDTVQAAARENTEYFLGSLVLVKTSAKQVLEVLDGQQRLATLTILLAAFKAELSLINTQAAQEAIHSIDMALDVKVAQQLPAGIPLKKGINTHIRLNDRDCLFYEDLIRVKAPSPVHRSHELILKAYEFFGQKIRETVASGGLYSDVVHLWDDFEAALTDYLLYVRIEVSDIDTAQAVFESLNSAGLALTKADLIKNYLLMESRPNQQAALALWDTTVDALGSLDLTQYIRTFCNAKFEFVRTDRLYAAVKGIAVSRPALSSQVKPDIFLKDLSQSAIIYANLAAPDASVWTDPIVLRDLEDLRDLGATTVLVPLLAAYHAACAPGSATSFKDVVAKFLTFQVRSIVVGPRTANEFETQYSEWAVALSKCATTLAQVLGELDASITDDKQFLSDMERFQVKRLKTARVLLARINDHSAPKVGAAAGAGAGSISDTIRNGKTIHVEHVIPQSSTPYWDAVLKGDGLDREKVVDMFGNLTLLLGKRNIQVSNGPFIDQAGRAISPPKLDKNAAYGQASGDINHLLANVSSFGKQELDDRQAQLAQWAVSTWPK